MLITNQVATAPCTDPTQVRFLTFEGKAPPHSREWRVSATPGRLGRVNLPAFAIGS